MAKYNKNAKSAGKPTGQYTEVGKPVLKDEAGRRRSEYVKTFEVDGKWYNTPSIISGMEYEEDQLRDLYMEGAISAHGPFKTSEEAEYSSDRRSKLLGKTLLATKFQQR
tara:strand:- start:241 stop:567 length:327 start_codon:yes stop_codon:yes gene_type:complete